MIGRISHIAIAVPDLEKAAARYRDLLGADVSAPRALPEHGVAVVTVETGESRLELMTPLGTASPLASFLDIHPQGGMHHICFEVGDVRAATDRLVAQGARVRGAGGPTIGLNGAPVVFLEPADFDGVLIELEERPPDFQPA